jgi:membrane protein DedA with SNARE-associated domain
MAHSIFDFLRGALLQHGYWALAVTLLLENAGVPLPGETILLLASFLAYSEHALRLPWIIAVATVAAALGDNLGFVLGYYGGRPLLDRYQSIFRIQRKTLAKAEKLFARFGSATVFFARFVFGMRVIAGPLAGVLRMPWQKFVIANFLGAALWVTVISVAGYLFGRHWSQLMDGVKRLDIALALLALLAIAYFWWRGRRNGRDKGR